MMTNKRVGAALLLAVAFNTVGCGIDQPDPTSPPLTPAPMSSSSSPILVLSEKTGARLSGTLSEGDHRIAFTIEKSAASHVTTVSDGQGKLLLRTEITGNDEAVDVGQIVSLRGPRGSLFASTEPNWDQVIVVGELSQAASVLSNPDFPLTGMLGQILSQRRDIDPAILPVLAPISLEVAPASDPAPSDPTLLENHSPVGCAFCHTGCAVAVAACVAATWGIFSWLCIAPGVACHGSCAATICQ